MKNERRDSRTRTPDARKRDLSGGAPAAFMWVWVLGWWGAMLLIAAVNGEKLRASFAESWWNIALVAVFIGAGLAGLWIAIALSLSWWHEGRDLPGPEKAARRPRR